MNPPLPDIRPGETIIINGERFVTRSAWRNFGIAWCCAVDMEGGEVLFWSMFSRPELNKGCTLRRNGRNGGRDTFHLVESVNRDGAR